MNFLNLFRHQKEAIATVAFNMKPVLNPWGGGNQFVLQLAKYLEQTGFKVTYALNQKVDLIVLVDPRVQDTVHFGVSEIQEYLKVNPKVKVLHRVNECDQRKNSSFMDDLLKNTNEVADFTVFISDWLKGYHAEKWYDTRKPHRVIINGADPSVFHPIGGEIWAPGKKFRLVTHHWSKNELKGFAEYAEVDSLISEGMNDFELWIIGRWPDEMKFKTAKLLPPCNGKELAQLLRQCHGYITASRYEPGGMHFIEGAQCGLPLVYHQDGGGIVEVGRPMGVGFTGSVKDAIIALRDGYQKYRESLLNEPPSGDLMCLQYRRVIVQMLSV
ncbi:MAG: hypothetical protein SGI71_08515 [Verrucomicrobiota bacterium]|nr:hypothetical protein [Verrucomicrobiota bacterium]